eukprot:scaffold1304_cov57-Phaeocystis_antarctica.AAC.1
MACSATAFSLASALGSRCVSSLRVAGLLRLLLDKNIDATCPPCACSSSSSSRIFALPPVSYAMY